MFQKNEFTYKILTYVAFFLVVQDHQLCPIDINRCSHMSKFFHLLFVSKNVQSHLISIRYLMLMTNLIPVVLESTNTFNRLRKNYKKKKLTKKLVFFISYSYMVFFNSTTAKFTINRTSPAIQRHNAD